MASQSRGAVLIIVLWFIMLAMMVISYQLMTTRLAVKVVQYQFEHQQDKVSIMNAVEHAKYEILQYGNIRNNPFLLAAKKENVPQFNGEIYELSYPVDPSIQVRIIDHAGRININRLPRIRMKEFLKKQLVLNNNQLDEMLDSWDDWKDGDELKRLNGAEDEYYLKLNPAYSAANKPLQRVDELFLIKGYDEHPELLDHINSLTVHGTHNSINPNFANRETLSLIPGVSLATADKIIQYRNQQSIKRLSELDQFWEEGEINLTRGWFSFLKSRYFSIIVFKQDQLAANNNQANNLEFFYAYEEIVWMKNNKEKPLTIQVFPQKKFKYSNFTSAQELSADS